MFSPMLPAAGAAASKKKKKKKLMKRKKKAGKKWGRGVRATREKKKKKKIVFPNVGMYIYRYCLSIILFKYTELSKNPPPQNNK